MCFASSAGAQALDTSRLPRAAGAKEIYASPPTTIYTAPDPVARTAEAADKALAADGWRQYRAPNADQAQNPDTQVLSFKKGPQALSVLVTLTPGKGKTANVNYAAVALANDLPFPPDASDIAFDPNKPYFSCATSQPIETMLEFFRKELGALGWSPAPAAEGAKPAAAGEKAAKGAHAFFVRDNQPPLMLVVQRDDGGRTKVELQSVSADLLLAESRHGKPAPAPAAPAKIAAATAKAEKPNASSDEMGDAITKQAQQAADQAIAEALSGAKAPAAPVPATASADPVAPLGVLAESAASIPLPETAEEVDFDGAEGRLEFNSASSVKAVAAFFRAAMKPLGWKERPSVINKANMVELDFSKAGKDLSLTIMQMGQKTNVTGSGAGLVDAAAKPDAESAAAAPATPQDLEADETDGYPVPKNHTMSGTEATPFRHGLNANVPVDMASVLAFYRRELGKRGWKEQSPGTDVKPDQAALAFSSPDGPALLKLVYKDGETIVTLVVRDQVKAAKAGIAPKPGQGKVLFGNVLGAEAVFTINKQTIKVAAGAGAKGPDGPTLDLPPGKYKVAAKVAGQPAKTEEVDVGADETWGLLVGPGGVLPLQMY